MTEIIINTEAQLIDFLHQVREQINTLGTQIAELHNGNIKRDQEMVNLRRDIASLKRDMLDWKPGSFDGAC